MIDIAALKEALDIDICARSQEQDAIITDAARLVLAAWSADGEVEAALAVWRNHAQASSFRKPAVAQDAMRDALVAAALYRQRDGHHD